jgi:PhnB protein
MAIHEVFPYLCVSDAKAAIEFYTAAFGGKEKFRLTEPSGRIGHAEIELGDTTLMLSDEYPEYGIQSPTRIGGTGLTIHLHVDNADELIQRMVDLGATLHFPPSDHFYGERSGSVFDPFGHRWMIGHSIEQVSPEEMQRRYTKAIESGGTCE